MTSNQTYSRSSHQSEPESIPFSSRANPYNNVCDQCYRRKLSCSRGQPACERCQQSSQQCTYSVIRPVGRPKRLESDENRQRRRSVMRNAIRTHAQALQRKGLYTPISQTSLEDPRDSQASPRSSQKEEIRRKNTGAQMHNDPNGSETAIFFHSDLGTALQPISYGSQTDQAYQNHPSRSGEGITNGRAERHGQTLAQPNNIQAISEPMATTGLDCDGLPPLSPALDEEFLDLNFSSHERLYIDLEPQHSNSTTSGSEDKCHCLLYIIQSLNRNRQETHTRRDSMNRIQLLNEAAEQFLMCDSNHSKLWYIILLALYQDADDSLSSPGELQEMVGEQSEAKESYGNAKSSLNGMNSKRRNVLLKTFILLSSTASALPFKFGIDADDKFSSEIMESFAGLVRDRFENRLLEQTDEARLCK